MNCFILVDLVSDSLCIEMSVFLRKGNQTVCSRFMPFLRYLPVLFLELTADGTCNELLGVNIGEESAWVGFQLFQAESLASILCRKFVSKSALFSLRLKSETSRHTAIRSV